MPLRLVSCWVLDLSLPYWAVDAGGDVKFREPFAEALARSMSPPSNAGQVVLTVLLSGEARRQAHNILDLTTTLRLDCLEETESCIDRTSGPASFLRPPTTTCRFDTSIQPTLLTNRYESYPPR